MGLHAYSSKFLPAANENTGVIIQCDQCLKTFKRNIQLKAHSKRHAMTDMDGVGFCGFESINLPEKKQYLDELIKIMDTKIHKEKLAFNQLLKLTY